MNKPNRFRLGFFRNDEKKRNFLMAFVVVLAVSSTFAYLINKDSTKESAIGGFLGNLMSESIQIDNDEALSGEAVQDEKDSYKMETQVGEGLTHLARRALKEYLEEDSLSVEEKIFAEDYIQKKKGSQLLEVGEIVEIEIDLIKEAIDEAKSLTESELNNLKQYSMLVSSL